MMFLKLLMRIVDLYVPASEKLNDDQRKAVDELMTYNDRELSDLGLTRSSIVQAVLHGRDGKQSCHA